MIQGKKYNLKQNLVDLNVEYLLHTHHFDYEQQLADEWTKNIFSSLRKNFAI